MHQELYTVKLTWSARFYERPSAAIEVTEHLKGSNKENVIGSLLRPPQRLVVKKVSRSKVSSAVSKYVASMSRPIMCNGGPDKPVSSFVEHFMLLVPDIHDCHTFCAHYVSAPLRHSKRIKKKRGKEKSNAC